MKLYCVQVPWYGPSTPDEYPGGYKWFRSAVPEAATEEETHDD